MADITALSALLLADAGVEVSADNMTAVINASGNSVDSSTVEMYATFVEKAGGVDKFTAGPGCGGGGGAAPAAGGAAAVVEEAKPVEEEVDPMEGGMDMFGGGGGDY